MNWLYGLGVWLLERFGSDKTRKVLTYGRAYGMGYRKLFWTGLRQ